MDGSGETHGCGVGNVIAVIARSARKLNRNKPRSDRALVWSRYTLEECLHVEDTGVHVTRAVARTYSVLSVII